MINDQKGVCSPPESQAEPVSQGSSQNLLREEIAPKEKTNDNGTRPQVSQAKIAANRRNARHSTGPSTPEGKKTASRNALKHGFFSRWLIIEDADVDETRHEYNLIYAEIVHHYRPVGFEERLRCEEVAWCLWQRRSLLRYEHGQIAQYRAHHRLAVGNLTTSEVSIGGAETDAITDHLRLLTKDDLGRYSRYDSAINRRLNFALGELERFQARRKSRSTKPEADPVWEANAEVHHLKDEFKGRNPEQ